MFLLDEHFASSRVIEAAARDKKNKNRMRWKNKIAATETWFEWLE